MGDVKKVYYTNGEQNRKFEPGKQPEGWVLGKRKLSEEEKRVRREKVQGTLISHYGSLENAQKERIKKQELTNLQKYGCKNVFQNDDIKNKIKDTNLKNLGVDNPSKSNEVKDKKRKTYQDHYGVKCNFQIDSILKKAIENSHTEDAQSKRKNTNIEKYGVTNVAMIPEVQDKIKQTCLNKYGVSNAFQRPGIVKFYSNNSGPNQIFSNKLRDAGIEFNTEVNIGGKRYDFQLTDSNVLIEINPTTTHNSTFSPWDTPKDKNYHSEKTLIANQFGYRCVHIFDWDDPDKILKTLSKCEKIYARKCFIQVIEESTANKFISQNHFQNACKKQEICIGLFYNEELVSVMTFGKPRYNKKYDYELLRYCASKNIIGGAEKIFNYFINNYKFNSIISYCDNSKFNGETYTKLGFNLISYGNPTRHWYNMKTNTHITDNLLRQRGFDQLFKTNYGKGTSNEELMLQYGFVVVYDCGQSSYEYIKN